MDEPFDILIDSVDPIVVAHGIVLRLGKSHIGDGKDGGRTITQEDVGTIRMHFEHAKLMAFLLRRALAGYEQQFDVSVSVPASILNFNQISDGEWDEFWSDVDVPQLGEG